MKVVAPQVKEGTIDVDQSALTGESLPVTLRGGDAAQMGATVVRGETHATGGDALCVTPVCLEHCACPSTKLPCVVNATTTTTCAWSHRNCYAWAISMLGFRFNA